MGKLRNISTGVVISFDDALADSFSANDWEPVDGPRPRSVAKKAAPARKRAAKKTAAKKAAPVAKKAAAAAAAAAAADNA